MSIKIYHNVKPNEALAIQEIVKESNGRFVYFDETFRYCVEFEDSVSYKLFNQRWNEYCNLVKPITEKKPASFFKKIARRIIGEFKNRNLK